MSETLYFNPRKALHILLDNGVSPDAAIAHLVRLKETEHAIQFDGTTYYNPATLADITE